MRILLISGEYPPMQGGVGDYTREMARAFATLGHDVRVLVSRSLDDAYPQQDADGWHVLPLVHNWQWGCWREIRSVIDRVQPDVVNVQYQAAVYDMRVPAMNLLPWRARHWRGSPPLVVTYHDLKPPYLFPKAGLLRASVVRALARYSDAAILTNAEDLVAASGWGFVQPYNDPNIRRPSRPTLHQIPIGSNIPVVPPAGFERSAWRTQLGYDADDFVWAYFGFLNESKGGEALIGALARTQRMVADSGFEPAKLLMIGGRVGSSDPTNQAYAARVDALIAELGVGEHVQWTGYVPTQEVSAALLSADVVVLPYRDGISFRRGSFHAALAHGCAIVSTTPRVPLAELHHGENILLVRPEDPEALCEAVLRLQRCPALRQRIAYGAKELAAQFTWDRIAQRTVDEVFGPLMGSCQASGPGCHARPGSS